jgi:YHS domain-containing protein
MINISRRSVLVSFFMFSLVAQLGETTLAADNPGASANRVALSGHDPVSYFTAGRPEEGLAEFSASFEDATYWFKNAEHHALFVGDPERYAPQFGGLCAIDLSRGNKTEPDPEAWVIVDGKLYVFGKKIGPALFAEQRTSILEKSTQNWRELRKNR